MIRILAPALALLFALHVPGQNAKPDSHWSQFRGPRARGVADGFPLPTTWNVQKGTGVLWKTPIPGMAHSSPVVFGERIFLTTAVSQGDPETLESLYGSKGYGAPKSAPSDRAFSWRVLCLNRDTGKVLWTRTAHEGQPRAKRHPKASHANPTPACDAENVVASFGSEGLHCYDHHGKLRWKRDLGVLDSGAPGFRGESNYQWGFASSPVIQNNRVFVQCDHEGTSFVAALDLQTGEDVWRKKREENSTWCTPTVLDAGAGGRSQLLLNGYKHIGGYDLETGQERWKLVGGGDVPVPTPVVAHGLIFLTSAHGRSRPIRAVKTTASGTLITDPDKEKHLAWSLPRRGIYMQTPIVYGDLLYCCSDGGILTCYEAKTGERIYRERLGSGTTGFSASAVAGDGKLYFSGESGEIFVVQAGREFKLLATNDMGQTCMATPALSRGMLILRTRHHLIATQTRSPSGG